MLKMMGFCGFSTTKNHKVNDNDAGEVHVILKRKYRQYMNRKGGFNRPLDFVAWMCSKTLPSMNKDKTDEDLNTSVKIEIDCVEIQPCSKFLHD